MCACVLVAGGEGYRVTAQMVLVCCWRSMKEVSMLLGQLCQSLPLVCSTEEETSRPGLISEEQVRRRTLHTIHSFGFIYTKNKLFNHLCHTLTNYGLWPGNGPLGFFSLAQTTGKTGIHFDFIALYRPSQLNH